MSVRFLDLIFSFQIPCCCSPHCMLWTPIAGVIVILQSVATSGAGICIHWWHFAPHSTFGLLLFFPKAAGLEGRTETGRNVAGAQPLRAFRSSQHPRVASPAPAGWVSAGGLSERRRTRQGHRWCWLSTRLLVTCWSDSAPGTGNFLVLS